MSGAKEAVRAILAASAGVQALAASRIFPNMIPQEDFDSASQKPCVVYARTGVNRLGLLCGTGKTEASDFRLDCYGRTYAAAEGLAVAVRAAVKDYRGTIGGRLIRHISLDNEFDLLDPEPGLHRVTLLVTVWHDEP